MKVKKIPMRMCLGCRQMKPKKEMIRIVKMQDGTVKLRREKQADAEHMSVKIRIVWRRV